MPSWNIHLAHVEALVGAPEFMELGISNVGEFLFGNTLPDIPLGYMVKTPKLSLSYTTTHLTRGEHIPLPDAQLFWERYIAADSYVLDITLGAWAHLLCDHVYNAHTRAFFKEHGIQVSEQARIAKQADFAAFGGSLPLTMRPTLTDELLAHAAAFPQYSLGKQDVCSALEVIDGIVEKNSHPNVVSAERFTILDEYFFASAFQDAHTQLLEKLMQRQKQLL